MPQENNIACAVAAEQRAIQFEQAKHIMQLCKTALLHRMIHMMRIAPATLHQAAPLRLNYFYDNRLAKLLRLLQTTQLIVVTV